MNLREETIKVLREVTDNYDPGVDDAFEDGYETEVVVSMGLIRIARSLLSRLEAGSGEETGAVGWWNYSINYGPDGEENYANVYTPDGKLVGNLRINHAIAIVDGLNAAKADRPHVATPAPGENSGRAEARRIVLTYIRGTRPTITHAEMVEDIEAALAAKFAAGRRSGLEEAAKAVNEEAALATTFVETATYGRAATIIRAIPEKQS